MFASDWSTLKLLKPLRHFQIQDVSVLKNSHMMRFEKAVFYWTAIEPTLPAPTASMTYGRATWLDTLCADRRGNWDFFSFNNSPLLWIYNRGEMRLYIKLRWGRGASRSHGNSWVWNNRKLSNRSDREAREESTRRKSGDSPMTASAAAAAAVEINLPRLRASAASKRLAKTQREGEKSKLHFFIAYHHSASRQSHRILCFRDISKL